MKKGMNIMLKSYIKDIKNEFKGYDLLNFKQDLMAGGEVTKVGVSLVLISWQV